MDPIQASGFSLRDLLAHASGTPRNVAVAGWRGYTMVALKPAGDSGAWGVVSAKSVGPENNACFLRDRAADLAHQELLRQAPEDIRLKWRFCTTSRHPVDDYAGTPGQNDDSPFYETAAWDPAGGWGCMRAWLKPCGAAAELAVVYILPDLVWGTIFLGVRGPLVAIVQSTGNAPDQRVHRVCLGADAWTHLDAATAAFRDRWCAPAPAAPVSPSAIQAVAHEYKRAFGAPAPVPSAPPRDDAPPPLDGFLSLATRPCERPIGRHAGVRVTMSATPMCTEGASLVLALAGADSRYAEVWSALAVADIPADSPLRTAIFAPK